MMSIEILLGKLLDNLIYAPFFGIFIGPIKRKVNSFLKKIWPWYVNSIYKSASANNTNRPAIFSIIILVAFVFLISEYTLLSIYDPSLPVIDDAINQYSEQTDKLFLVLIFAVNVLLFILVMRIEVVHSTIAKFNQMLAIIRPNITNGKYYELKQQWVLMKSAEVYKIIMYNLFSNNKILLDNKEKFPDEIKTYKKIE